MVMAGMIVRRSDDKASAIHSAMGANKMRKLRLVTLGALHRRDGVELPVRGAAATRLRARRLPF